MVWGNVTTKGVSFERLSSEISEPFQRQVLNKAPAPVGCAVISGLKCCFLCLGQSATDKKKYAPRAGSLHSAQEKVIIDM